MTSRAALCFLAINTPLIGEQTEVYWKKNLILDARQIAAISSFSDSSVTAKEQVFANSYHMEIDEILLLQLFLQVEWEVVTSLYVSVNGAVCIICL